MFIASFSYPSSPSWPTCRHYFSQRYLNVKHSFFSPHFFSLSILACLATTRSLNGSRSIQLSLKAVLLNLFLLVALLWQEFVKNTYCLVFCSVFCGHRIYTCQLDLSRRSCIGAIWSMGFAFPFFRYMTVLGKPDALSPTRIVLSQCSVMPVANNFKPDNTALVGLLGQAWWKNCQSEKFCEVY